MFRLLLTAAISLLLSAPAQAKLSGDSFEHAISAFTFAERRDWVNAMGHAKKVGDNAFVKLISWEYMLDNDSGATFEEIVSFIENNPTWPEQKKLHIRAEMALHQGNTPDKDVIETFGEITPITGVGKIALTEAWKRNGLASSSKIAALVHDAWRNGDFDEKQENKILDTYGDTLTREDHIARIDRLLWEERQAPARRILSLVPDGYQKLFKARMALLDDKRLAIITVAQVPASLKNDPGLTFDRLLFRARRDDDKGVREMLLMAPEKPPYPEKWWKYRESQVRVAVDEKNYSLAKKLLANHGQVDGSGLADAIWLRGWLDCEFLDHPRDGLSEFRDMYDKVKYPVSKARAAFWAGRAADKAGDRPTAENWYKTASSYPTTFYGQMGALKSKGNAPLAIPHSSDISGEAKRSFENSDYTRAIKLTMDAGNYDLARRLITLAVENTEDIAQITLATELGGKGGKAHLSVHAAKKALQQNVVLIEGGYPTPKTPSPTAIERPLTLAITRQESEFDPNAKSPSGALGMMQLLPRTAKEVAHKNDVPFALGRLGDASYNMNLGSLYLGRLINSYDGSYIMGIAAYNAGPGNVRNWTRKFGTPGNEVDSAINWIEKIPFYETRNYVQRVLENLQVYRAIESDGEQRLALADDLKR